MNNWKKRFIIIWTGQLFSILSSNIAQFAIVLWISMRTGSAEVLAYATIAGLVPQIIIGPFAGVFVDRWNRRWTMIGADCFVALCSAVMALLFYIDFVELWSIYLLLMLRSVGNAFHSPAMKSSITLLAPESEYTRVAGINQTIQSVCMICGPALGAVFVVSMDMSWIMMIDVAGAVIASVSLMFVLIPSPKKEVKSAQGVISDMRDGFRAILDNRGLSWIMLSEIVVTFFFMPVIALVPLMTLEHFQGTPYQVGLAEIMFGGGTFIGGMVLGVWNPKIGKVVMLCSSYLAFGVALLVSGLLSSTGFAWYAAMCVLQGIAVPYYTAPLTALMQSNIEEARQGRAFSLFDSISLLPSVFGLLFTGFLADTFGIALIFTVSGVVIIGAAVVVMFIPSAKRLN